MILIGIADDGSLTGLADAGTSKERDTLRRRIEGLCASVIKPSITPVVKFGREDGAVVLAIEVPRGQQPIYYSRNRPYVRHLSESRPAEPHEVIERISEWLATTPQAAAENDAHDRFFSSLASTLIDVLIYGDEFEDRTINPWLDLVLSQLAGSGADLRQLAADEIAIDRSLDGPIREIADNLERAASLLRVLDGDSWQTLRDLVSHAVDQAHRLKAQHIDPIRLSQDSIRKICDLLRRTSRELADLDRRAPGMAEEAGMDEVQDEASRLGYRLLRLSHYRSDDIPADLTAQLFEIGRDLHLIETERLYVDGGQSMRTILEHLHTLAKRLVDLLARHQI